MNVSSTSSGGAAPTFAQPSPGGVHLTLGLVDMEGAAPPDEVLDTFIASVHPWVSARTSYWHCEAGVNRSCLLLAWYLCTHQRLSADEAITQLRARRVSRKYGLQPLCNRSFERALRARFR
jgi:protein-tyrosine phosphatase